MKATLGGSVEGALFAGQAGMPARPETEESQRVRDKINPVTIVPHDGDGPARP